MMRHLEANFTRELKKIGARPQRLQALLRAIILARQKDATGAAEKNLLSIGRTALCRGYMKYAALVIATVIAIKRD
jgi:hypothetical protein